MLKRIYNFFADARAQRMARYRDYKYESRKYDHLSTAELMSSIEDDWVISLKDIRHVLNSLQNRSALSFSDDDYANFYSPLFQNLENAIKREEILAYVSPEEPVRQYARVKVKDLIGYAQAFDLPAGRPQDPEAQQDLAVAIDPYFDENTVLGRFQKKVNQSFPLRTPSVPVEYKKENIGRKLDMLRPFVLAAGLSAIHMNQQANIEHYDIPAYGDTKNERALIAKERSSYKAYRGQRYG